MTTTPSAATGSLSPSECWAQLRQATVGRLAVVSGGRPDIFPVNFVVDHGTVVFRTAAGTKLAAARTMDVAFEVDGYDAATAEAWSVVLKGDASEVREVDDTIRALRLPLFPWHGGRKPHVVRITPTSVTGRRFVVSGGFTTGADPDGGTRDARGAEPEPGVDP
jgi:nitroimidazol reductase NimA-like FMN-containing flavoprotein (pyridoxamine 5'-phosphate oxidase superfamily)